MKRARYLLWLGAMVFCLASVSGCKKKGSSSDSKAKPADAMESKSMVRPAGAMASDSKTQPSPQAAKQ
jgi:hypothetical protein